MTTLSPSNRKKTFVNKRATNASFRFFAFIALSLYLFIPLTSAYSLLSALGFFLKILQLWFSIFLQWFPSFVTVSLYATLLSLAGLFLQLARFLVPLSADGLFPTHSGRKISGNGKVGATGNPSMTLSLPMQSIVCKTNVLPHCSWILFMELTGPFHHLLPFNPRLMVMLLSYYQLQFIFWWNL